MKILIVQNSGGETVWQFEKLFDRQGWQPEFLYLSKPSIRAVIRPNEFYLQTDDSKTIALHEFERVVFMPFNGSERARSLIAISEEDEYATFKRDQWEGINRLFDQFLEEVPRCINRPSCVTKFSNKIYYYQKLAEYGFNVPPWICTNDPETIGAEHLRECLFKTPAFHNVASDDSLVFASTFHDRPLEDVKSGIAFAPCLVQKFVASTVQWRVYFFDTKLVAFRFRPDLDQPVVDWRSLSNDDLRITVSDDTEQFLSIAEFLRSSDVSYAAVDIIEDDRRLWICDVNPTGSWHWLPAEYKSLLAENFLSLVERVMTR